MDARYIYVDPRGTKSGPLTESELERLAEAGGIEWTGSVELEGVGRAWRVSEITWLSDAIQRGRGRRREVIEGTAVPRDEPSGSAAAATPPAAPPDAQPGSPAGWTPTTASTGWAPPYPPTNPPAQQPEPRSTCSRQAFVLLAVLPPLVGIFGLHNLAAGYTGRGVIQLVLSIFTLGGPLGIAVGMFALPCCCCFGVPLWPALVAWVLIEVATVRRDARGAPIA